MTLIHWRWESAPGVPALAKKRCGKSVATAFGKWLGERIASMSIDYPNIAFHHVELCPAAVELALLVDGSEQTALMLRRLHALLERETTIGALQCDWIQRAPLWQSTPNVLRDGARRRRVSYSAE